MWWLSDGLCGDRQILMLCPLDDLCGDRQMTNVSDDLS